jgi:GntR family transcriptional regulator, transcriptional repressor for pyruvate dehydrogenase complex
MVSDPQPKLRRKRLSETLTEQLRKHIVDEGLKPGDRLLSEQEMVERFGVSHTVVREATKTLDFLGIINTAPRRGMVLDEFDFDRVGQYLGFHLALSNYPKDRLFKARAIIEMGSLFCVAEQMKNDPDVYTRLRTLAEATPPEDSPRDAWFELDLAFHRGLVEETGAEPLLSFCDLLQAFFRRFRTRMLEGSSHGGHKVHCQIVDALRQQDMDKAVELLRLHLSLYEDEKDRPKEAHKQAHSKKKVDRR